MVAKAYAKNTLSSICAETHRLSYLTEVSHFVSALARRRKQTDENYEDGISADSDANYAVNHGPSGLHVAHPAPGSILNDLEAI